MEKTIINCPHCGRIISLNDQTDRPKVTCPQCGGLRSFRNGKRNKTIQTYICRDCGYRFIDSKSYQRVPRLLRHLYDWAWTGRPRSRFALWEKRAKHIRQTLFFPRDKGTKITNAEGLNQMPVKGLQ